MPASSLYQTWRGFELWYCREIFHGRNGNVSGDSMEGFFNLLHSGVNHNMLHISTNAVRLGKVEVAASSVGIRPEVDEWQSVDSWRLTLVGAKALLEPHYEVDY